MEHAYDKIYLEDIMWYQAKMFALVTQKYEHPNMDQFVTDYMKSRVRKHIDYAWPKFANLLPHELLDFFLEDANYTVPEGQCRMDYNMALWVGLFYAYYQWYWNIKSADLIEWFPTMELGPRYPGMHTKDLPLVAESCPPERLPCYKPPKSN